MLFWPNWKTSPAHWLVVSLVIVTFLLRIPLLNGSFWLDEAAQILESARPWSQQFQIQADFQPPLLHILTFVTRHISVNEAWLRFWGAVLPSLIVTWGMLRLLGEWWPTTTPSYRLKATWLGLLLATNSLWVFYSQELRPYSLAVMWTVLSWWLIVKLTKSAGAGVAAAWKNWLGWSLTVLGGLYSTYLFPFVLISQGLYLLWQAWHQPKLWPGLIGACLIILAGFAPWVPSFLGQLEAGQQLRTDLPGWEKVVSTGQLKTLPLAMGKFLFGVVDLELNVQYLSVAVVIAGMFAWLSWQLASQLKAKLNQSPNKKLDINSQAIRSALTVFIWWVIVPLVLAWLVSFKVPVIQPKRILFALPALYGLAVILGTEVKFRWPKLVLPQLALVSLLLINVWSLSEYYRKPVYQRENWRQIHNQLLPLFPAEKTLAVFAFPAPFASWQWYDRNTYPSLNLGYLTQPNQVDVTDRLKTAGDKYTYVLVFEYLEPLTDPALSVKSSLQSLGWKEIHAVSQPGVGFIRVYAKPTNLLSLISSS